MLLQSYSKYMPCVCNIILYEAQNLYDNVTLLRPPFGDYLDEYNRALYLGCDQFSTVHMAAWNLNLHSKGIRSWYDALVTTMKPDT